MSKYEIALCKVKSDTYTPPPCFKSDCMRLWMNMRRKIGFVLTTVLAAIVLVGVPGVALSRVNLVQVTLPGTNTPKPTVFDFSTNTPAGPTSTPSRTPTATDTATATATASFTPTASSTPTD